MRKAVISWLVALLLFLPTQPSFAKHGPRQQCSMIGAFKALAIGLLAFSGSATALSNENNTVNAVSCTVALPSSVPASFPLIESVAQIDGTLQFQDAVQISTCDQKISAPSSPSRDFSALKTGDVITVPVDDIHPSQTGVGHQLIKRIYEQNKSDSPEKVQADLTRKAMGAVIAPNGMIFLSDGHHRATTAQLKEQQDHSPGKYSMKLKITENYAGQTWADFGAKAFKENTLFLGHQAKKNLYKRLKKKINASPEKQEEIWRETILRNIPSDFVSLPDNPMRSLVGEILDEMKVMPSEFTENFYEFFIAEAIEKKLGDHLDPEDYVKTCKLSEDAWDCEDLGLIKERVKNLILDDKDVRSTLLSLVKTVPCKDSNGSEISCRNLAEAKLDALALGESQSGGI